LRPRTPFHVAGNFLTHSGELSIHSILSVLAAPRGLAGAVPLVQRQSGLQGYLRRRDPFTQLIVGTDANSENQTGCVVRRTGHGLSLDCAKCNVEPCRRDVGCFAEDRELGRETLLPARRVPATDSGSDVSNFGGADRCDDD
jgi:hypothetical protein